MNDDLVTWDGRIPHTAAERDALWDAFTDTSASAPDERTRERMGNALHVSDLMYITGVLPEDARNTLPA